MNLRLGRAKNFGVLVYGDETGQKSADRLVVGHSPTTDSSMKARKTGRACSCVPLRKV